MPIHPVGARLLVKRIKPDSKLVLPEPKDLRDWVLVPAEVIAVGEGAVLESGERVPVIARPGQTVLIPSNVGYRITDSGEDYIMLNERDVVAILEGSTDVLGRSA